MPKATVKKIRQERKVAAEKTAKKVRKKLPAQVATSTAPKLQLPKQAKEQYQLSDEEVEKARKQYRSAAIQ
jgi:hypothetical protein